MMKKAGTVSFSYALAPTTITRFFIGSYDWNLMKRTRYCVHEYAPRELSGGLAI
jgi:hypothetical protein